MTGAAWHPLAGGRGWSAHPLPQDRPGAGGEAPGFLRSAGRLLASMFPVGVCLRVSARPPAGWSRPQVLLCSAVAFARGRSVTLAHHTWGRA